MTDTPTNEIPWGPTGELVYNRTYSRTKPDGSKETWPETVARVVDGNLALVDSKYQIGNEREDLIRMMTEFKILPAGRHLWASGVKNAQHLFNCWVSGWPTDISDHFQFTFMRLMEGGGVGANYSNRYLEQYGPVQHFLSVEIVCDPDHADYQEMKDAGILSDKYDSEWTGAYPIEDSREGWASALVDLIDTHYRADTVNFHRVYDVSRVRPAGAKLKTFGGVASGPKPFAEMLQKVSTILSDRSGVKLTGIDAMSIDHAIAQCVVAGGVRRSARMAMMHWADHQIEEFINCKQESGDHWTTNISVEVDEEFWKYASKDPRDEGYGTLVDQLKAETVLGALATGAVRNGEPGMWDSSYSNKGEPNEVVCTNPCGEITLEPWEPCNLGHINLAAFVTENGRTDHLELLRAHQLMTRFLIRATFSPVGDPKSREVLDRNRRIGVGHLGVASYLAKTGIRYSMAPQMHSVRGLLRELARKVDDEAIQFSHDLRIPVPVKKRTIAPTGTVAKMPGVSEGIHPIFSRYFLRRVRFNQNSDFEALAKLVNEGYEVEEDLFAPNTAVVTIPTKDTLLQEVTDLYGEDNAEDLVESADELSLGQLFAFQSLYQQLWADNAVSFTANVDPERYSADDVADTMQRFAGLIKGSTIFPEASFPQAPYERITKAQFEAYEAVSVADGVDENCSNGACPIK
ncbi:ribonucleotide reductase [Gordonia phage LastResort]|uniref:ribonucleotide reductase n=1 Tax=Gordonia phage JSwag TaxID=1887649 RepID=UPI00084F167A|nr:ribonucleotide reductase [Gordonia phage JSwag]AXH47853.1 ribonucleotide reductase [Gordonia phage LastResort]QDM56231.1 ribonucleotide reductase [Gordonia phage ReMo]QLF84927.1 ribonucleotide reductase [Gordonia phage Epsocamisio]QZD98704.1 ribonucleotide reductase [Gordonia phage Looper]UAJ15547.1 ribonucleotide reductase [Gordonia Phage Boohoo]UVD39802.1 ribonucleotide reductase [Gordonia phage Anaysia]WKW87368.1 ribonucleotide reductase [Gordonia phage Nebulosus]